MSTKGYDGKYHTLKDVLTKKSLNETEPRKAYYS